ncbi:MAG: sugar phosphate isomerase/epimerase [Candidatus Aenigmatarchaeota archaeon]|nr:MAG: sugar phosphate isomerase/epimerase [Candidatus Aenigmarchaeota archaeon]
MKIGFPNNPRKDLLKEIEWIGKNKFDFVDLFLEEDQAVPEKIDIEKTKKLLRKYRLGVTGHTAWYLPIGSPIKALREASVKEAVRYFEVFSKLGVEFVTIHANWPSGMFSEKEGIKFQVETLKKLVKEAKRFNLKIMYEPIDTYADNVINVSEILRRVSDLFLHLDIGHANLFGRMPEEFIKKFRNKIKHVHLHDNNSDKDLHLPMGCGSIDWEKTLKTLKKYYNGTITLEVFSKDKDYALLTKEKLRKLWNKL